MSSAVTAAVSPRSFPHSSTGRFEVSNRGGSLVTAHDIQFEQVRGGHDILDGFNRSREPPQVHKQGGSPVPTSRTRAKAT